MSRTNGPHGRIVTGNPSGQHCLSIRERPQPWQPPTRGTAAGLVVVRHESDLAGAHRGTTARDLPEDAENCRDLSSRSDSMPKYIDPSHGCPDTRTRPTGRLIPLRGSDLDKTPSPRGLAGDQPIGVAGDGI